MYLGYDVKTQRTILSVSVKWFVTLSYVIFET